MGQDRKGGWRQAMPEGPATAHPGLKATDPHKTGLPLAATLTRPRSQPTPRPSRQGPVLSLDPGLCHAQANSLQSLQSGHGQPGCPSLEKNFCRPPVRDQGPRLPGTPHGHPRCATLSKGPRRVRLEPGRPGVRGRPAGGLTSVARPSPHRRRGPRPWQSAAGARTGCRGPSPCPTRPPQCRA